MKRAEHKHRHIELHKALDELVADFIAHGAAGTRGPSKTTVLELMTWAYEQTLNPTLRADEAYEEDN